MKGWRPFVLVLEGGGLEAALGHEEEGPHGVQVEHGRLHLRQLDGCDAHRPDVAQVVIAALALHCRYLRIGQFFQEA